MGKMEAPVLCAFLVLGPDFQNFLKDLRKILRRFENRAPALVLVLIMYAPSPTGRRGRAATMVLTAAD